jgi:prophage regulatory protein
MTKIAPSDRLITKRELCKMVPYTPQHILRLEKRGKFPRRIQVGPNRVAWLLSEVEAWISDRVAERNTSLKLMM